MALRSRFQTYNDGVLYLCVQRPASSDFSAVTNPKRQSDICRLMKLDYREVTKREQDYTFAEGEEKTLDLKVKVMFHTLASVDKQVMIGKVLYDIFKVDYGNNRKNMYLYLQKARDLT